MNDNIELTSQQHAIVQLALEFASIGESLRRAMEMLQVIMGVQDE
jgi:hypothetical protein